MSEWKDCWNAVTSWLTDPSFSSASSSSSSMWCRHRHHRWQWRHAICPFHRCQFILPFLHSPSIMTRVSFFAPPVVVVFLLPRFIGYSFIRACQSAAVNWRMVVCEHHSPAGPEKIPFTPLPNHHPPTSSRLIFPLQPTNG